METASCVRLIENTDLKVQAVGTSSCDIFAFDSETNIITSGCYTGSLTDGFSVKLEIQDATDATTIFSTFDGITCTIGTDIQVADLTLSVTTPTFEGITEDDTAAEVTLTVIADGAVDASPYSNVEFGSEVAIVAQLTVDPSFSATMSGCEVKVGAADAVAP